ncbi:MAG: hypothetical protein CMK93_03880, partial [Pseudomonas sp.]|nr:hypothetical protein [Pseudomonas sp.]
MTWISTFTHSKTHNLCCRCKDVCHELSCHPPVPPPAAAVDVWLEQLRFCCRSHRPWYELAANRPVRPGGPDADARCA